MSEDNANESLEHKGEAKRVKSSIWAPILGSIGVATLVAAAFSAGLLWNQNQSLERQLRESGSTAQNRSDEAVRTLSGQDLVPARMESDWIRGAQNGDVVVIEYSDLECPFCKRFHNTANQLVSEFGDRVSFVFRHLPLPIHEGAAKQALASECVGEAAGPQAFYGFIDRIFDQTKSKGDSFSDDRLRSIAAEVGVASRSLDSCMLSGVRQQVIDSHVSQSRAVGVTATPSVVVLRRDGSKSPVVIRGAQSIDVFRTQISNFL